MKKEVFCSSVAKAPCILSQAVEANGFIFVSGMIGVDTEWNVVAGGIQEECKMAFKNVESILQKAGLDMNDIVRVVIYVLDMKSAALVNEVYSSLFMVPMPAREMVGVNELPLGAFIEISVTASR